MSQRDCIASMATRSMSDVKAGLLHSACNGVDRSVSLFTLSQSVGLVARIPISKAFVLSASVHT